MSPSESASLAIEHLQYVAMLSLLFVVAAALYLTSFWTVAWRLTTTSRFLVHTLYLLWQSHLCFVVVVAMNVAVELQRASGDALAGWNWAPAMVPGSALLFVAMTVLTMVLAVTSRGDA